jgi:hypothetical protein
MKKLDEWEAWIYLAIFFDAKLAREDGICVEMEYLYHNFISQQTFTQMRDRMQTKKPKKARYDDFWWPTHNISVRSKFCWRMAELADGEGMI